MDGLATVYVNGKPLDPVALGGVAPKKGGKQPAAGTVPRRAPFEVDMSAAVRSGENVVAVRVDNRRISELFLGGILRPVLLVEKPPK